MESTVSSSAAGPCCSIWHHSVDLNISRSLKLYSPCQVVLFLFASKQRLQNVLFSSCCCCSCEFFPFFFYDLFRIISQGYYTRWPHTGIGALSKYNKHLLSSPSFTIQYDCEPCFHLFPPHFMSSRSLCFLIRHIHLMASRFYDIITAQTWSSKFIYNIRKTSSTWITVGFQAERIDPFFYGSQILNWPIIFLFFFRAALCGFGPGGCWKKPTRKFKIEQDWTR